MAYFHRLTKSSICQAHHILLCLPPFLLICNKEQTKSNSGGAQTVVFVAEKTGFQNFPFEAIHTLCIQTMVVGADCRLAVKQAIQRISTKKLEKILQMLRSDDYIVFNEIYLEVLLSRSEYTNQYKPFPVAKNVCSWLPLLNVGME